MLRCRGGSLFGPRVIRFRRWTRSRRVASFSVQSPTVHRPPSTVHRPIARPACRPSSEPLAHKLARSLASREGPPLAIASPMLCRSYSAGILGVEGYVITVEADVDLGLPCLTIIGQVSGALDEARERVRSAIQ